MKSAPRSTTRGGFTMLELVLALLLMTLLVGMIFATANSNIALSRSVIDRQNEEGVKTAFFELLNQRFTSMPGNTRMKLTSTDGGSHYISDLTLQNVPMTFSWSGTEKVAKAVQLSTVLKRDGYLDIVLRYYENEILSDTDNANDNPTGEKPFAEIILLEDVRTFEWRVLDSRTMEWQYDWDIQGRLPLQMELVVAFGANDDPIRQVFWITPKQNPETLMRQLAQAGGSTTGTRTGETTVTPQIPPGP
jgi:Type II secretion system (T2SS), protein J